MELKPPPISSPWRTDKLGRLIAPEWINWLQTLVNAAQLQSVFSDTLTLQSIGTSSSSGQTPSSDESSFMLEMLQPPELSTFTVDPSLEIALGSPQSSSTAPNDDALMFSWMSF